MSSREKSPYYGSLQQVVDSLFADLTEEERIADMAGVPGARKVRRLDVILAAEAVDLPDELQEIGLFGGFCGRDSGIGPAQRAKTTIWN